MDQIITDEERARRLDAVNFARANVSLEGFTLDSIWENLAKRFVAGEIEISELVNANIARANE